MAAPRAAAAQEGRPCHHRRLHSLWYVLLLQRMPHRQLTFRFLPGAIERFTLPRSAGRQAYHDARKAAWGDLFPHPEAAKGKTERVPAASDERMPAARGVQRTPTGKKVRRELLSSAAAIGADLVAPRDREGRGGDAEAAARGKNMVGRRAHYSRGAGDARAPRPSRKRSMGDYEIEPEDAEVASEEHVAQQ